MTYSKKHAKQFYLQGFTERHRVAGKATNKKKGAKVSQSCISFCIVVPFFSFSPKLCYRLNRNNSVEINGAHHNNLIYPLYCTKKSSPSEE